MTNAKEVAVYSAMAVAIALIGASVHILNAVPDPENRSIMAVTQVPPVAWRNDRVPTQQDACNRAGLVWLWNGGKAKLRFCHNIEAGDYWATIVSPPPPREKWVMSIIDAVEDM